MSKQSMGELSIEPANAADYVDRSRDFSHKIDHDDLCYKLFTEHGFEWGGDWTHSRIISTLKNSADNFYGSI